MGILFDGDAVFLLSRKAVLEEYSEITSLLSDEIVKVHKEIHTSIEQIDPSSEYDNFIETHRYHCVRICLTCCLVD